MILTAVLPSAIVFNSLLGLMCKRTSLALYFDIRFGYITSDTVELQSAQEPYQP
jgi:hypothetical protein